MGGNKFINAIRQKNYNKYGAKKTFYDGQKFDSKYECSVYQFLRKREQLGEISGLERQITVRFFNLPKKSEDIALRVDFKFIENGREIYAEAKGMETKDWLIKKKLWKLLVKKELRIYQDGGNNPKLKEVLCSEQGDVK